MIAVEIPFSAGRSYQSTDVTIDNVPLTLTMLWNEYGQYWSLSVAELGGEVLISNVKCVASYPLTSRYQRTGLKGDFYFLHRSGLSPRPTFDDLGTNYSLYYFDAATPETLPTPIPATGSLTTIWDDGATVWDGGDTTWF